MDAAVEVMRRTVAEHQIACGFPLNPSRQPGVPAAPEARAGQQGVTFQECAECAAKSGAPTLCTACRHNRALADELQRLFQAGVAVQQCRLTITNRIVHRDRLAVRRLHDILDDMVRRGWEP